ncbi:hypothetical protein CKA32_003372 [Geitlerinema sp. FC II]|nr:hypothetical protein CKA32_003372 [Geitlerinema sp. FC II]
MESPCVHAGEDVKQVTVSAIHFNVLAMFLQFYLDKVAQLCIEIRSIEPLISPIPLTRANLQAKLELVLILRTSFTHKITYENFKYGSNPEILSTVS